MIARQSRRKLLVQTVAPSPKRDAAAREELRKLRAEFDRAHPRLILEARKARFKAARGELQFDSDDAHARLKRELDLIEGQLTRNTAPKVRIQRPAGGWMLDVAGTVFSKKTRERVFEQIVADFRDEHCEALSDGAGRARMAFLIGRHWTGFALAVVMQGGRQIAKAIKTLKGAG